MKNPIFYRIVQLVGFIVGARVLVTLLLTFALYVSIFFLFNQEESLRQFAFDFRIHGIVFCTVLSILAGGIINQFYDREKDQLAKPFRSRVQSFLKQKYFLYAYLLLNVVSLGIAGLISWRVLVFFLIYQFMMWFYSHKLSKILIVNNFTFVALTLYPFFGMLVYYRTFSLKVFMMAAFLFIMLLLIDIIKDMLTKRVDFIFGYRTLPNFFGDQVSRNIVFFLLATAFGVSLVIAEWLGIRRILGWYFLGALPLFVTAVFLLKDGKRKSKFIVLNIFRLWIFAGILAMLADGIMMKY
ncbi:UbiA family prenyltransferase [Chryseobacterium sp. MFBS3-17]|uniref:UbiA family prenyltransferase n=1 Tax=Chryseobacterium sp. MFBS3-17 TaxID=2886689 RepID=UPI001D0DDF3C|nr:UbiA family prenyltransferase [Chryseobacterium sp. MFBS3-17]MCC2590150.1 UbiA family prenyltransferase [Chryseobacterium sp. MFBS3-17]